MTFSFSNKQNTDASQASQSKPAAAKYVSAHKAHFKNWRSNRMYRSVRYSQPPLFGISKIFAPAHLFSLMFIACFLFSCSKQKDQMAKKEEKSEEQAKMEATLPGFSEENSQRVAWDKLPAKLKDAVPVQSLKQGKEEQYTATLWSTYSYAMGPWGGWGGGAYSIYPPNGSRIYAIGISSGSLIDRIVIWYQTWDGTIYVGGDRGGYGGYFNVQFFSADEHITAIGGRSGAYLDRLTVYTNKKWFSYGGFGGTPFFAAVPPGYQILGFWGGSGIYIDRIGFWVYTL